MPRYRPRIGSVDTRPVTRGKASADDVIISAAAMPAAVLGAPGGVLATLVDHEHGLSAAAAPGGAADAEKQLIRALSARVTKASQGSASGDNAEEK